MSGWANLDETPPSLPDTQPKRLPEANKLARMVRSGRTISDLAVRYNIRGSEIIQRLTSNGWDASNGKWVGGDPKDYQGPPLAVLGGGPGESRHHVGGGDNPNGVPTTVRPFTERPKPKGFAWPEPAEIPAPVKRKPPVRRRTRTFALSEANKARRKLSDTDRIEIARRYEQNLESSVVLASDYNVNQRTIRNRNEAGRIRWQHEHEHGGAA